MDILAASLPHAFRAAMPATRATLCLERLHYT